jgi:soluble cytochrome b562
LKSVLSSPTISNATIPDELISAINGNLMNLESAKNNPELSKHFKATIYNGVDNELLNTLKETGDYETIKDVIDAERSSTKKMSLAIKKIKELAATTTNKGELKDYQEKINILTKQINEINSAKAAEVQSITDKLTSEFSAKLEGLAYENLLSSKKLANPLGWEKDLLTLAAKTEIGKALESKGYIKKMTERGFELQTKEGTQVFENNKPVSFNDFADRVLLDKKLLEVANPVQPNTQNSTNQGARIPANGKLSKWAAKAMQNAENAPSIS